MISCSNSSENPSPELSFSSRASMNWGWEENQSQGCAPPRAPQGPWNVDPYLGTRSPVLPVPKSGLVPRDQTPALQTTHPLSAWLGELHPIFKNLRTRPHPEGLESSPTPDLRGLPHTRDPNWNPAPPTPIPDQGPRNLGPTSSSRGLKMFLALRVQRLSVVGSAGFRAACLPLGDPGEGVPHWRGANPSLKPRNLLQL